MKFAGYVTVRLNSKRVPQKSIAKVGGIPLVDRVIRVLAQVPEVDHTLLYCSDANITKYITPQESYTFMPRPEYLDGDNITFNDILDTIVDKLSVTHIVFITCTSPFLKPETISDMIQKVKNGWFDSAFTATEHKTFAWYGLRPLNYSLDKPVPQTQKLQPVYLETSSAYVFSVAGYKRNHQRIGINPYIKVVDIFEGWDIDTKEDLAMANLIAMEHANE